MRRGRPPLSHRGIIELLGDNRSVAAAIGVTHSGVCRWKSRGIPPAYWTAIERLARLRKVPLRIADIEASSTSPKLRRLRVA